MSKAKDTENQRQRFLNGLCTHIVCMSGTAIQLDKEGGPIGQPIYFHFSGFVVSLYGIWMWVTAGHSLKKLDVQIDNEDVKLVSCGLVDAYGTGESVAPSIPFGYLDCNRYYIDDDAAGRDIGIIPLRPYYSGMLKRNQVVAFAQEAWELQSQLKFDSYGILGFPEELHSREKKLLPGGVTVIGGARPVLLMANESQEVPPNKPTPETSWLAVKLKGKGDLKSIVGMSGGPILGFMQKPGKPAKYLPVAVQSFWESDRGIAYGTRLSPVISDFDNELRATAQRYKSANTSTRKRPAKRAGKE